MEGGADVQIDVLLAYCFAVILLYVLLRVLVIPLRYGLLILYNALVGGAVLLVVNLIGGLFGFHLALNPVTAIIVGFLGVPGLLLLAFFNYYLF